MAWFTPAQSFAEGWQPGPQLQAGNISGVLGDILKQHQFEELQRRQQLADMIKAGQAVRQDIQGSKYVDALKAQGLVPEDYDVGGAAGADLGMGLAKEIQRKREQDALEAHRQKMYGLAEARAGRGGRGGGDATAGTTGPETTWDDQGREWRPGPGGRWIPVTSPRGAGAAGGAAGPKPQTQDQIMREQARLLEEKDQMDQEIAQQRAANITALKPNVPYTRQGQYNRTVNRLKQLQQVPGMPTTDEPGAIKTPNASTAPPPDVSTTPPLLQRPTADQAGGHAESYGVPAEIAPSRDKAVAGQTYYAPDGSIRVRGND